MRKKVTECGERYQEAHGNRTTQAPSVTVAGVWEVRKADIGLNVIPVYIPSAHWPQSYA